MSRCSRGHEFTELTTRIDGAGRRQCRVCEAMKSEKPVERSRRDLLEMVKTLNDWRMQDTDVRDLVRAVLNRHEVGSVGALLAEHEDVFVALYDSAEQFMSDELQVSREPT